MILLQRLSLLCLLPGLTFAVEDSWPGCSKPPESETKACLEPVEDVVAITPGASYAAKIRCHNCPYHPVIAGRQEDLVSGDTDLFFNITLSHDKRFILLNDATLFPTLRTIPKPPQIFTLELPPDLTYTNLSKTLGCSDIRCRTQVRQHEDICASWCHEVQIDSLPIDYLYTTQSTEYQGKHSSDGAEYWEFTVDAIGGYDGYLKDPKWGFDNPKQKILKVVVEGIEVGRQRFRGEKDMQAASSLFGPFGEPEKVYDYRILEVTLVPRIFTFPAAKPLSFGQKISRFFGNDIWQEQDHRLLYIGIEWDLYGKEGTLRNMFGNLVHWQFWDIVWITLGATIASIIVLVGSYKLFYWVQAQRELMRWNGMDDVWDNLRREREEEENRLLAGNYRDDPEEGGSSGPPRYTDDVDTMKPLPAKPLPDKPLPAVPLIDA